MAGRREQTTALIRAAAVAELAEVGPRAFTLQSVAKRAFISTGAVYERWPNTAACIRDLALNELPTCVEEVTAAWLASDADVDELTLRDLTDPVTLGALRFIIECAFAARDERDLQPFVSQEIHRLGHTIARQMDLDHIEPAFSWWLACTWLGHALLATSGCPIPSTFAPEFASLIARMPHGFPRHTWASPRLAQIEPPVPPTSPMKAADRTGEALIQAAAAVIAAEGLHAADTRRVADEAGMTTGAIYRRYAGKGEMLDDVLKAALTPERYAWVRDFIAALSSERGVDAAATYLAALVARTWTDERNAQLLLEITVAAHTDTTVRAGVMREITKVADARTELLEQFVESGFIRPHVSASTLGWLLQIPPVGMRVLASIGFIPTQDDLRDLMAVYLAYLLFDNRPSLRIGSPDPLGESP